MIKKFLIAIIVLLTLTAPRVTGAAELIKKGETLNLGRCIEIALANQPNILAAANTVRANESKVGQAKANYYPQIAWSSGYSRNYTAPSATGILAQGGEYDDYGSHLTLSQNIYDFGKTSGQVKTLSLNAASSRRDLDNVTSEIVFMVKQAYFDLLKVTQNRQVAAETVNQFQQHLDQARAFFRVGAKPKFDVTKAEVDLSNAKLTFLTAENSVKIAWVTLNNAMGVPGAPEYGVENALAYQPYEVVSLEEALKKAYAQRPDLQSIALKKESLEKSVDLAKTGYYPFITGTANYGFQGPDFPLYEGWMVGAQLNVPLFSGNLTRYQVEEARANLEVLKANEESLRQSIYLDVQQAYLNLQVARDQISTAALAVRQASENQDLANGRYAAGVGNPIEVTDSLVVQANARMAHVAALYNFKVAQAGIEKAMGLVK